jgi:excisionase family DNA binding protein
MQEIVSYTSYDTTFSLPQLPKEPPMTKTAEQDYYTVAGTAAFLSVNPSTIWRWIKSGKLPAYRVGHKNIRIRKQDLAAVIQPAKGSEVSMDKEREALFAPPSTAGPGGRQQESLHHCPRS